MGSESVYRSVANLSRNDVNELITDFRNSSDLIPKIVPGVERFDLREAIEDSDVITYKGVIHVRYRIFAGSFSFTAEIHRLEEMRFKATKRSIEILSSQVTVETVSPRQTAFNSVITVGQEFAFLKGILANRYYHIVDHALISLEQIKKAG